MAVLMTLGELATVAGAQLRADVPEILPLVIDAIQDGSSPTKRLVAVGTLGQVRAVWARRKVLLPVAASSLAALSWDSAAAASHPAPQNQTHHCPSLTRWLAPPAAWFRLTLSTRSCWACCCAC